MSPERKRKLLRVFTARLWLVAALVVLVSGLILGANLALLGYAQPRDDPVGQLTPARLMQIERSLPKETVTTGVISPKPRPDDDDQIEGEDSDD